MEEQDLKTQLQSSTAGFLVNRRGVVAASLLGMAAMTAVTLLQTGLVKHLPDPPLKGFESDRVNLSKMAFGMGVPDGTLSLASLAINVVLASAGGADRFRKHPLLPLVAGTKAIAEGLVTVVYFLDMPLKQKAWCPYCITGAVANWAVMLLSIPESISAFRETKKRAAPVA